MFKWQPDLLNWHKEGKGVYVRNDGLAKVERKGNQWVPSLRASLEDAWVESRWAYGALHAAQDHCRRLSR